MTTPEVIKKLRKISRCSTKEETTRGNRWSMRDYFYKTKNHVALATLNKVAIDVLNQPPTYDPDLYRVIIICFQI